MNENSETFVIYMIVPEVETLIHLLRAAKIAALWWDKVSTKISDKYTKYWDVFFSKLAMELPGNTGINEYIIELVEDKQPSYSSIYAFSPVKLEILKTYIKTHLKT